MSSKQSLRLLQFVAEMKKNNFPNAKSFATALSRHNSEISCTSRTISRDIEMLRNDYHAPIEYDHNRCGYYLTQPDWELKMPIMDKDIFDTVLLSSQLTLNILPEPLKNKVSESVDKALANNSSSLFDSAMIESLLCTSGIKSAVDPEIFKRIFDAWSSNQTVKIDYQKPNDPNVAEHTFDPHIVAFYQGNWYAKGYKYGTKEIRVYAIHRITSVTSGIDTFETDKKLVRDTKRNGLFEFPKIDGIQLLCDQRIAFYLREHQKVKKFKIDEQPDGSLIITLKPAIEHDVIRWILGAAGDIEVLYPPELREKVAELSKKIWEKNSAPQAK